MISSAQRYGVGLQQTSLIWDPALRTMSLGGSYDPPQVRGSAHSSEAAQERILDHLAINPHSGTEDIRRALGMKGLTVFSETKALLEGGKIVCHGGGVRNDPHRYSMAELPIEGATN